MVLVLDESAVDDLLDYADLLDIVESALVAQGRGDVERPPRPHFPVDTGTASGTGLVMAAYVHGGDTFATKVVGVYEGNADRGLPTINATILLNDAETGLPKAILAGTGITNARTGCIGGLAARELAVEPVHLAVFGAGPQARAQTRAVAAATDLESVAVYSPSDSKFAFAEDLDAELDADVRAADSPSAAVESANIVVTATTATDPVFEGEDLRPGTLVVAVGAFTAEMCELDAETFSHAAAVYADVPEEVAEIGDVLEAGLSETDLVQFSEVLEGSAGRESPDDVIVVESVGSAVLDQATGEFVYERACERGLGTDVDL